MIILSALAILISQGNIYIFGGVLVFYDLAIIGFINRKRLLNVFKLDNLDA